MAFRQDDAATYDNPSIHDSVVDPKSTTQSFHSAALQLCGAFFFIYIGVESESCFLGHVRRRMLNPSVLTTYRLLHWLVNRIHEARQTC